MCFEMNKALSYDLLNKKTPMTLSVTGVLIVMPFVLPYLQLDVLLDTAS